MPRDLRLGTDPLGGIAESAAGDRASPGPGGVEALDRILSVPAAAPACPAPPSRDHAGPAAGEPDACARAREFLDGLIDDAEVTLSRRPDLSVEMEGELADLSMQDAYLVGHALKILLGLGAGPSGKTRSDAALGIRLTSRLSGRVELSVTDDGTFFPEDMRIRDPADQDVRELVSFVTGRGGSLLVTRLVATRVAVVIWGRAAAGPPPRVNA